MGGSSMKKKELFGMFCIACCLIVGLAMPVGATIFDVRQNFPGHNQGENGIYLQYRTGANYIDLTNYNPFIPDHTNDAAVFVNMGDSASDFFPTILGYEYNIITPSTNQISAAPSCTPRNNVDGDAVIRILIPNDGKVVRISGYCGITPNPDKDNSLFYIYKGEGNYNIPIWTGVDGNSFDFTIPYSNGDQLFFATRAGSQCKGNDLDYWKYLTLETKSGEIPTPEFPSIFLPVALIIGFLGTVLYIKRTREN
jgi:hypothetical protein